MVLDVQLTANQNILHTVLKIGKYGGPYVRKRFHNFNLVSRNNVFQRTSFTKTVICKQEMANGIYYNVLYLLWWF